MEIFNGFMHTNAAMMNIYTKICTKDNMVSKTSAQYCIAPFGVFFAAGFIIVSIDFCFEICAALFFLWDWTGPLDPTGINKPWNPVTNLLCHVLQMVWLIDILIYKNGFSLYRHIKI